MKANSAQKQFFTRELMQWHHTDNDRSLPWKQEKDPYRIWLSEIILQQTRAQQGLPYYLRFVEAYPTIKHMAKAADEDVFRLWQGLGYYNRCKNMLASARYIVNELNGKFPNTYESLLALKGIGPYTAAAIGSFAFNLPCAVVDGNVYRVLARYFGIETATDTTEGKNLFQSLALELLEVKKSAAYNQAIMDLGATVCTPANYSCDSCPLQSKCFAYPKGIVGDLPIKSKKLTIRKRYFHYVLFIVNDKVWIHKRTDKDIWQNLHEPYLIENDTVLDTKGISTWLKKSSMAVSSKKIAYEGMLSQKLTHRIIESHFFRVELEKQIQIPEKEGNWMLIKDLKKVAFPKSIVSYLEKIFYF
ncbi:MAG: A/G-specific adenine glycosylase [Bacteroidota bacterium]